jgi:tetratricopeptide (TPR) repeat protein
MTRASPRNPGPFRLRVHRRHGPEGSRGEVLLARESYGEAEAFYRKALESRPGDGDLQQGLARARSGWVRKALQRSFPPALGSLDEALDRDETGGCPGTGLGMAVPADTGPEYDQEAAALVSILDERLRPLWTRPWPSPVPREPPGRVRGWLQRRPPLE